MIFEIIAFLFFASLSVIFIYSGIKGVSGKVNDSSNLRWTIFGRFFTKFGFRVAGALYIVFGLVLGIVALKIVTLLI